MCVSDVTATEIQIEHIDSSIMRKIVDFMEYHKNVPPKPLECPLKSTNMVSKKLCLCVCVFAFIFRARMRICTHFFLFASNPD